MTSSEPVVEVGEIEPRDVDSINQLLATHEPWTEYDEQFHVEGVTLATIGETAMARIEGAFAGFAWWIPNGGFDRSGYLKLIGVHRDHQSAGVGTALMDAAEESMFDDFRRPDVFLLVSSFNDRAREFYVDRGYVEVGCLPDYVEDGIDELLLRKTR